MYTNITKKTRNQQPEQITDSNHFRKNSLGPKIGFENNPKKNHDTRSKIEGDGMGRVLGNVI